MPASLWVHLHCNILQLGIDGSYQDKMSKVGGAEECGEMVGVWKVKQTGFGAQKKWVGGYCMQTQEETELVMEKSQVTYMRADIVYAHSGTVQLGAEILKCLNQKSPG